MRLKILVVSLALAFIFSACSKKEEAKAPANLNPNAHKVLVKEVLQVTQYTYLRVTEDDREYWIAASKQDIQKGATVYYLGSMEMKNFESKELGRKFDSVLFVQQLSPQPILIPETPGTPEGMKATPQRPTIEKINVAVPLAKGGITISKLYSNPELYKTKTVFISGKVTKVNSGIMQKNWVHIQDGTASGNNYDLTVTTQDVVNVGDIVTFQGRVSLNKDFGYGYSYKLLLEDATTLKNL
jgi:hypothetical protein